MKTKIIYNPGDLVGSCSFVEEKPVKIVGLKTVRRFATFKCFCGNYFDTYILNVKNGNTKSCGCLRDSKIKKQGFKNKTHGYRKHPLYRMWQGMLDRCKNPNNFSYYNYGKRGINVSKEWLDIAVFIKDMYPSYAKGLELDRINVNGNYEISNCRWVTRKQNMNNTRKNRHIEYNGVTKTVSEWSDYTNIPYKTLLQRLNNWTVEKSLTYK